MEAIGLIQQELAGRVPLIGFAGAPFTLASYAIEGGPSNNFARTKSLMYRHPEAWHRLCARLASMAADYLTAQIDAGVDAVSIVDLPWREASRARTHLQDAGMVPMPALAPTTPDDRGAHN